MQQMRAIGVRKGKTEVELFTIPKPEIAHPNEALLRMVQVGVCGTDKDIIEKSLVDSPQNEDRLILGHEGLAEVIETGPSVKGLVKGDHVAIIPRHGCNICPPCKTGRSDFCETGLYTASGQHKRHGFNSEFYIEEQQYMVKVPRNAFEVAVLTEPISIVEKAIMQITGIQERIPCYEPKKRKVLVFGTGSVGISAVAALQAHGMRPHVLGRRPRTDPKIQLIEELGATYINAKNKSVLDIKKEAGEMDIIIEATGATQLVIDLIDLLSRNGIYAFLGIPKGSEQLCFNISGMLNKIVRQNIILLGSVNSQREHFEAAIKTITEIQKKHKGTLEKTITHRYRINQYKEAFGKDKEDTVKSVIDYTESDSTGGG